MPQNVKGQIKYDPDSGKIIVLPYNTQWKRDQNGRWDKHSMYINVMIQLHEARQQIHWFEVERLPRLGIFSEDARQSRMARHLAMVSRRLFEYENRVEYLEWMRMVAAA